MENPQNATLNEKESSASEPESSVVWGGGGGGGGNRWGDSESFPITVEHARSQFRKYLDFLFLSDCLLISPSPINFVEGNMRELSICDNDSQNTSQANLIDLLNNAMIIKAWQIPSAHPIRKLLAEACTKNYIASMLTP